MNFILILQVEGCHPQRINLQINASRCSLFKALLNPLVRKFAKISCKRDSKNSLSADIHVFSMFTIERQITRLEFPMTDRFISESDRLFPRSVQSQSKFNGYSPVAFSANEIFFVL